MNIYTEKQKLEKANCILSIIENAEKKIKVCKWHIKTQNVFYPQTYWEKQIDIHQEAIVWLENKYKNLILKSI